MKVSEVCPFWKLHNEPILLFVPAPRPPTLLCGPPPHLLSIVSANHSDRDPPSVVTSPLLSPWPFAFLFLTPVDTVSAPDNPDQLSHFRTPCEVTYSSSRIGYTIFGRSLFSLLQWEKRIFQKTRRASKPFRDGREHGTF